MMKDIVGSTSTDYGTIRQGGKMINFMPDYRFANRSPECMSTMSRAVWGLLIQLHMQASILLLNLDSPVSRC
jgi:hypothetical protein